ncbi:hypothetical protein [Vulgatibacter sp.]|uniref:hypothetical protein n=1 Tax=Vulgatibacter sp. TaxID=1971226 RepID=UPI0035621286
MGRWDYLYDLQPRAALDVLLDEAAKAFAEDLQQWPPPLEGIEPAGAARTLNVLQGPRPHRLAFDQAFALARLDLAHEYEAIDRWQDDGWRSAQLNEGERDAAIFLWRYLTERLFDLNESLQSKLKRRDLVELVDRIERRFLAPSLFV